MYPSEQSMSHLRPQPSRHAKASTRTPRPNAAKQLRLVVAAVLSVGVFAALLVSWEQLFPTPPPERLIKIYRTHGCRCAFALADSLKADGFVVRLHEYETLQYVRHSLHTPSNLRGCHVGEFLGYFLESHVAPSALRQLAQQRPRALGLATEGSVDHTSTHVSIANDARSPALRVLLDGQARTWFDPAEPQRMTP